MEDNFWTNHKDIVGQYIPIIIVRLHCTKCKCQCKSTGDTTQIISAAKSNNYAVSITDKGKCSATDTVRVDIYKSTNAGFSYSTNSLLVFYQPTDTTQSNYFWDFGDLSNSSQRSPSHFYSSFGSYKVVLTVTKNTPCAIQTSKSIVLTGLETTKAENTLSIYPNPTSGQTYLNYSGSRAGKLTIEVHDQAGRLVIVPVAMNIDVGLNNIEIPAIPSLANGIYFIKVRLNGNEYNFRLCKMNE
ncbi:MAG: PKD domain-containing protein [Bacteroidota bacterium]|nr:PKD domain-containing protein [Bacteroidota bacterium]